MRERNAVFWIIRDDHSFFQKKAQYNTQGGVFLIKTFIRIEGFNKHRPMDKIDYAEGINCPDCYDDDQMLAEFIIQDDCELCYLDTYMTETFGV
jgi:hypothetical protein